MASAVDASNYSAGSIQMWYSGNEENESVVGSVDYLILEYYNGSGWSALPNASFGVPANSYTFLNYTIPAQYLTNNLKIRIRFDATYRNEKLFVDDTVIKFY